MFIDDAFNKKDKKPYTCEKFFVAYDHIYFDMGESYGK